MQPTRYDPRAMQNRQSSSLGAMGGPRRYFAGAPRSSVLPSSSLYDDNSFNDNQTGYWDDQGGVQSAVDKPTGLRHFSTKVCEKVKEKGLTNYNEVADELVSDYFQNNIMKQIDVVKQEYDMKNIRRRVYDALNVLLAMNIITKNKKDIRWIGLPASASQEISRLEEEKARREASIKTKMETLQEMIMQIVAYKNLVARNRKQEHENGRPAPDSILHLPFLIINTDKDANVECSVSSDKSEFLFSFDKRFEIHDDFEVLKKMKLTCGLDNGSSTPSEIEKAKSFLPPLHQHYVDDIIDNFKKNEKRALEEERKKQMLASQPHSQMYYEPSMSAQTSRFNRQLQEHLNDVTEDQTAAAGIVEKDELSNDKPFGFSPQKNFIRPAAGSSAQPTTTTRRYYVQKTPQGTVKTEISPAVRTVNRPYMQPGERRLVGAGGTVGAAVKYYVSQNQQSSQNAQAQRYRVRPPPPAGQTQQTQPRVVYSSSTQLPPGQRIISQRVVGAGGPHPPGTIIRKVVRKVVVAGGGGPPKQSPAQQVIQRKMQEQHELQERKPADDQPMTSAQAAALIQHPPTDDFEYF